MARHALSLAVAEALAAAALGGRRSCFIFDGVLGAPPLPTRALPSA